MKQATPLHDELRQQLIKNQFPCNEPAVTKLIHYLQLLEKWNQVYNLTSISHLQQMIPKHILDSLSIGPYLQGTRILDAGTGAGLPGVPLALTHPHCHFTLLDSNGKKTRFITHVIHELAISNIDVIHDRVERFHIDSCFDSIIARAFTSLSDFVQKTRHLVCQTGIFLSMKGQYPIQEIDDLQSTSAVASVHSIHIAGLDEQRHIIVVKLLPSDKGK